MNQVSILSTSFYDVASNLPVTKLCHSCLLCAWLGNIQFSPYVVQFSPANGVTDLSVLKKWFELLNLRNPKGMSDLPGINVFVSTAYPEKEPPFVTANTILFRSNVQFSQEQVLVGLS
ncbi:Cellulose synthase-like protein D5 [Trifolium repens]|nr:Cellulose synthase-like protein D5 [Trifolium repens]